MHDPDLQPTLALDPVRLERVLEVVALATAGAFSEAAAHASTDSEDTFGVLEQALALFIAELRDAREENERVMAELRAANLEIEQKLATIAAQRVAMREMSTPIIDV